MGKTIRKKEKLKERKKLKKRKPTVGGYSTFNVGLIYECQLV